MVKDLDPLNWRNGKNGKPYSENQPGGLFNFRESDWVTETIKLEDINNATTNAITADSEATQQQ